MPTNNLYCGGTNIDSMLTSPIYSSPPDIIVAYAYPATIGAGTGDTQVQQAAELDFGDLQHLLAVLSIPSVVLMIGETHSGTQNEGGTDTNHLACTTYPSTAPASTVAGFNAVAAGFAGTPVVLRPWMELEDPSGGCFPYPTYQNVNLNGSGPYTPSKQ